MHGYEGREQRRAPGTVSEASCSGSHTPYVLYVCVYVCVAGVVMVTDEASATHSKGMQCSERHSVHMIIADPL